jgi:hemerythrin superfamily protein
MATRKKRKGKAARPSSRPKRKQALMAAEKKRNQKSSRPQSRSARSSSGSARRSGLSARSPDAISLLRQDHREVETLFSQFEAASGHARKGSIAQKICDALTAHATIEEEIFYPQAREVLKQAGEDMMDEAEVEHEGIKWRIELIKKMKPEDDLYDAEVKCLKEYVEHHVKEEERKIFPKLRLSGFDGTVIGQQLAERKEEMTGKPVKEEPSLIERSLRALAGPRNAAPAPD